MRTKCYASFSDVLQHEKVGMICPATMYPGLGDDVYLDFYLNVSPMDISVQTTGGMEITVDGLVSTCSWYWISEGRKDQSGKVQTPPLVRHAKAIKKLFDDSVKAFIDIWNKGKDHKKSTISKIRKWMDKWEVQINDITSNFEVGSLRADLEICYMGDAVFGKQGEITDGARRWDYKTGKNIPAIWGQRPWSSSAVRHSMAQFKSVALVLGIMPWRIGLVYYMLYCGLFKHPETPEQIYDWLVQNMPVLFGDIDLSKDINKLNTMLEEIVRSYWLGVTFKFVNAIVATSPVVPITLSLEPLEDFMINNPPKAEPYLTYGTKVAVGSHSLRTLNLTHCMPSIHIYNYRDDKRDIICDTDYNMDEIGLSTGTRIMNTGRVIQPRNKTEFLFSIPSLAGTAMMSTKEPFWTNVNKKEILIGKQYTEQSTGYVPWGARLFIGAPMFKDRLLPLQELEVLGIVENVGLSKEQIILKWAESRESNLDDFIAGGASPLKGGIQCNDHPILKIALPIGYTGVKKNYNMFNEELTDNEKDLKEIEHCCTQIPIPELAIFIDPDQTTLTSKIKKYKKEKADKKEELTSKAEDKKEEKAK